MRQLLQLAGKEGTPNSGIPLGKGKGSFLDHMLECAPSGFLAQPMEADSGTKVAGARFFPGIMELVTEG